MAVVVNPGLDRSGPVFAAKTALTRPGIDSTRSLKVSCGIWHQDADLNCNVQEDSGAFYGVSSQYESPDNMTITCSTKVCSFGKQVVEKVE
ncbi:hypothetical protein QTP70_005029 [Hemibagrus guttatus]|uniref:YAP binding domain-containing protein n=1 Tax=Hemibagrus guttatus TaxID=175788 RepID=A0AAE0QWV7_9TELE|nr:hypothetical protein QTP70_005029 [Hemibagrus guttatus]